MNDLGAQPPPARRTEKRHRLRKRREPAAEEQDRREERHQDHVRVFGQEEHRERRARILDVESGDDFRLAFGDVERRAVGLGNTGDEIDDEHRQQRHEEPVEDAVATALRVDDIGKIEAAGEDQHADQREAHRDLVADDLRRRTHRAEHRVARVRRPAGEDDAVHAHRRHREQEQQARVRIRPRDVIAERNHRPRSERRHERPQRREQEQAAVRVGRIDDFLQQQLEHVGERLRETERADLFGPMRTCIQPMTLRSHHTYIATAMISGTSGNSSSPIAIDSVGNVSMNQ